MGLLDDLRLRTEGKKSIDAAEEARLKRLNEYYQQEIQPRMTLAYNYLREFIEHLDYLQIETTAHYPLLPQKKMVAFRQCDYSVSIDRREQTRLVALSCLCELDEEISFEIEGKNNILNHTDLLNGYQMKYHRKDFKDDAYELYKSEFILEGPIPVHVAIKGDLENSNAKLLLRNFKKPGLEEQTLLPHNFDENFLDRLGKNILREDVGMLELEMSEVDKARLSIRLEHEKQLRELEMREAERRFEEEERARLEQDKTYKLKKSITENREKLAGMFKKLKEQAKQNKPR